MTEEERLDTNRKRRERYHRQKRLRRKYGQDFSADGEDEDADGRDSPGGRSSSPEDGFPEAEEEEEEEEEEEGVEVRAEYVGGGDDEAGKPSSYPPNTGLGGMLQRL